MNVEKNLKEAEMQERREEEVQESREEEVQRLMQEIDERVNRFVELTGIKGKPVKRRWRDIKKRAGR